MSEPQVCISCRKPLHAYFEISRYSSSNAAPQNNVKCCSLVCLIKWAYESATLSGMKLAYGAKNTVTALLDSLRGSK